MKKPGILATMALTLAATLGPVATAQAAPAQSGPEATTTATSSTVATTAGGCVVMFDDGAPVAPILCNTEPRDIDWPDGRREWVMIGSDQQVWHTYQFSANGSWSNWSVLGSASGVQAGVWRWYSTLSTPVVKVYGSDSNYWCNTIGGNGMWTDWYTC
ncbi:hypothetical protein ACFXAF_21235 [Kitasatospora sp. NPDC059463]|uniref:hypothetical protein n=1 Tax=unclassified Kitasatospora TaxID=2633591 RepID=UPI0036ADC58F